MSRPLCPYSGLYLGWAKIHEKITQFGEEKSMKKLTLSKESGTDNIELLLKGFVPLKTKSPLWPTPIGKVP